MHTYKTVVLFLSFGLLAILPVSTAYTMQQHNKENVNLVVQNNGGK